MFGVFMNSEKWIVLSSLAIFYTCIQFVEEEEKEEEEEVEEEQQQQGGGGAARRRDEDCCGNGVGNE